MQHKTSALALALVLLTAPSAYADDPPPPNPDPQTAPPAPAPAPAPETTATPAADTTSTSPPKTTREERWKLGGFVEQDLGLLLAFGGVGLSGGLTMGNLRAGVGFQRFDSPYRALSGAPKGFDLKVDAILAADVAYHPFSTRIDGPYVRAIGHLKRQRVTNQANGVHKDLDSALVGPEIGWVFRVYKGLYLTPKVGALYYVSSPQGPDNRPVAVGGTAYDNPAHKTFDFYGSGGIGYVFD